MFSLPFPTNYEIIFIVISKNMPNCQEVLNNVPTCERECDAVNTADEYNSSEIHNCVGCNNQRGMRGYSRIKLSRAMSYIYFDCRVPMLTVIYGLSWPVAASLMPDFSVNTPFYFTPTCHAPTFFLTLGCRTGGYRR